MAGVVPRLRARPVRADLRAHAATTSSRPTTARGRLGSQRRPRQSWDGSWYRRAYFDDGTPLGTRDAEECRIDAIAQAWATISGLGDADRAATALDSVEEKLIRREDGLIALLTPPFDRTERDPGYIKGYVPGVRENGGQYTHAALWVVLAYLMRGDGDEAHSLHRPHQPDQSRPDAARPPSTTSSSPTWSPPTSTPHAPHTGRGGWTWYTGSASWFYRVALGSMLGIRTAVEGGVTYLVVDPCIPKRWPGFEITFRHGTATYRVAVENPRGVNRGVARITVDGEAAPDARLALSDDGAEHSVVVTLLGG